MPESRVEVVSHAEVRARRFRVSATVTVAVTVEETPARPVRRRPARSGRLPLGLQEPGAARWDVLPERIVPEQWTTGQADAAVPGAILAAESERRPEGHHGG